MVSTLNFIDESTLTNWRWINVDIMWTYVISTYIIVESTLSVCWDNINYILCTFFFRCSREYQWNWPEVPENFPVYHPNVNVQIPTNLVTNSLLFSFYPFLQTNFQQVFIIASHAYVKTMSNSTEFYEGIFLHVIPVPIIVTCSDD